MGSPSHDTFVRVLARLKPEELQQGFLSWMQAVSEVTHGEVMAIDGKTLRRSFDRAVGTSLERPYGRTGVLRMRCTGCWM